MTAARRPGPRSSFVDRWRRRLRSPQARLFLGLWLVYGILIDSGDLEAFNLQQMGVEAIVERGSLSVGGSPTPELQPGGDVFEHDGRLYAAKQPGQFFAGAFVYFFLHLLGLSYLENYLVVAALVTWLTASLATAAAATLLFRLARAWEGGASAWPAIVALCFGLATIALPYSGVTHHDALSTAYLVAAFYLVWTLARPAPSRWARSAASGAGFLLGWTITTSMLPFFMVVVVGLYFLSLRRWALLPWLTAGGLVGVAPLLAFNTLSFGTPFTAPNIAGNFSDTFLFLDWDNFTHHVVFYAKMVTLYVPIFWCGVAGLALYPPHLRRERLVLAALLVVLAAYVLDIETLGGCQYGPRYLLPAMPFAALGLLGFGFPKVPGLGTERLEELEERSTEDDLPPGPSLAGSGSLAHRSHAPLMIAAVALVSAAVNLMGALYGTMYCDLRRYAFLHYVEAIRHGLLRHFPLAPWLAVPFGLSLVPIRGAAVAHRGRGRRARPLSPRPDAVARHDPGRPQQRRGGGGSARALPSRSGAVRGDHVDLRHPAGDALPVRRGRERQASRDDDARPAGDVVGGRAGVPRHAAPPGAPSGAGDAGVDRLDGRCLVDLALSLRARRGPCDQCALLLPRLLPPARSRRARRRAGYRDDRRGRGSRSEPLCLHVVPRPRGRLRHARRSTSDPRRTAAGAAASPLRPRLGVDDRRVDSEPGLPARRPR
jgi:hypothetical protein